MTLKVSKTVRVCPYNQSKLQKAQWAQFAAIGYSIAIRGYLICWKELLKKAGFSSNSLSLIDEIIYMSRIAESSARWNIKHLKELK